MNRLDFVLMECMTGSLAVTQLEVASLIPEPSRVLFLGFGMMSVIA